MPLYNEKEIFTAERFPEMKEELFFLNKEIVNMPVYFKTEIVISYLKNHSIKNEWIKANPELVKFLLSGSFITKHTESLFDFCRFKPAFCDDFESYMKRTLLN
jgi:hypothetical protein